MNMFPNSKLAGSVNSKDLKTTPDFNPMIKIVFWNSLGFFFFIFLIPYATTQLLGASGTDLGFIFASQTLGGLLSAPIVGYLTDRVSKKLLVLIGSFGRSLSYVFMFLGIFFYSIIIFTFGLFILGVFVGFFWSPLDALIAEKSYKKNRSYAFGKRGGMLGKGNLLGSIVTLIIFALAYFFTPGNLILIYSPLLLFTASNIYAGIIFYRKVDEHLSFEHHIKKVYSAYPEILAKHQVISPTVVSSKKKSNITLLFIIGFFILNLAFMISNINQSLSQPFFQVYLIEELDIINPVIIMIIFFPSQVLSLLLSPKMGKISDKINPVIGIAIVSGLGSLVTWFVINTRLGWIFSLLLFFDATLAWGGMLFLQNILSRISKAHRGKIFGAKQWISLFGAVIGPILGGIAWDLYGSAAPFIISIFIELSLIPLYIAAILLLKPYMAEKLD